MAGVRYRGHDPVLCAAPARSRLHQVEPAEDHRRRHRLAILERAQTRAEGVSEVSIMCTRRRFLTTLSMAGTAGLLGARPGLTEKGGLETTTVRIASTAGICIAPQYVAEELLSAEGFTDVHYVRLAPGSNAPDGIAHGDVDFGLNFASVLVAALDHGVEMTVLGGVHMGCFELFANEGIRSLTELKGKKVGISWLESPGHLFLAAMAGHVGIDPGKDLHWVESQPALPIELFTGGKVDAFLGFPPDP